MPKMIAEIEKATSLFAEKGDKLPSRVLKVLLLFDESIAEVTNAMKKKMGKVTAQAHTKLKQKFKKYLQETNEGDYLYETQLAKYKEDPQDSAAEEDSDKEEEKSEEEEEEEEEESAESEADEEDAATKAAAAGAKEEAKKEGGADGDEYGDEYDDEYYDEEKDSDSDSEKEDEIDFSGAEIHPKLRSKYGFLWKQREEMTASERRWKWVKKESLPVDLTKLMDQLMGSKKKKKEDREEGAEGDEQKEKDAVEKEDFLTEIKRDYLNMDFSIYPTCQEILAELKAERMKVKYSAEYHTLVLQKIFDEMPCVESHEIKMKIEVITYLVSTLF